MFAYDQFKEFLLEQKFIIETDNQAVFHLKRMKKEKLSD